MEIDALAEPPVEIEPSIVCRDLIAALHDRRIEYCYWKSRSRAGLALSGATDLDLLIGRASQHAAERIVLSCGFKPFPSVPARAHPSMRSFLRYDGDSGKLFHVHLHGRLVLGSALSKTYLVPWESTLLSNAIPCGRSGLRMLDPASEAVLWVVRCCLEVRRTDPAVLRHWPEAIAKFASDRRTLTKFADAIAIRDRAEQLLGADLAAAVTAALFDNRGIEGNRVLRSAVRRRLVRFRMYGSLEAAIRLAGAAGHSLFGRLNRGYVHWPRPCNRVAPNGGIVVAILGVDGSGKSTLARGLREWLGREVDVLPIYFGTGGGRPSLLLWPFKTAVPLVTSILNQKPKGASHGAVSEAGPSVAYSVLLTLWATILAVEKRQKLLAARRGASRGMVVITDRYPQDQLLDFNDGPLLPRLPQVPGWLRRFEASAYALARDLSPDLVIKLVATPELIAEREPAMSPSVILKRTSDATKLSFSAAVVVNIPASQPVADVLRAAKDEVWRML